MNGDDDGGSSGGGWGYGHWPSGGSYFLALVLLGLGVFIFVNLVGYAYERVGISPGWFTGILIGSLVGSRINIPVWKFKEPARVEAQKVTVFGTTYNIPVRSSQDSILAVNVGGAIIPTAVSIYLIVHDHVWEHSLIAVACVSVVVFLIARPVQGVGIVMPPLVAPAVAAITAVIIGKPHLAAVAYVCGTLGTLIGADLMNLWRIKKMAAPEASIGGAGTFDGVFLSGLGAVVLASL